MSAINWTGAWSGTTTYNIGDAVSYLGSSYVASASNTSVAPPNALAWQVLASAGSTGAQGTAGLTGATGSGLYWLGAYNPLTAYSVNDCVSYSGSSYICTGNGVLNLAPDDNPAYWGVLCVGGAGGGGSATWGTITGTLSAQTDLETVLATYAVASSLATVATSGSYNDLSSTPTIPAAQVNSDWAAVSGVAQILNKPTIPTTTSQLTNNSGYIAVSGAPVQSVAGRTGAVTIAYTDVSGLATVAHSGSYNDLSNLPALGTAAYTATTAYDAAGAASTAQSNAETYSSNASNLSSGTVAAARLPAALSATTSVNGTAIPASATLLTTTVAASTYAPIITLTTTGTSGAATYSGNALNIPQYSGGSGMTYPAAAGIAVYAGGSAWGTSLTAPTSAIVGVSDTQTLTNKTIDGVTPTTMGYLDATSSIQTQLNSKQATINFVVGEVVSGSGTSFTLAYTPATGSVALYNGSARIYPGASNDYTISGATITMNYSVSSEVSMQITATKLATLSGIIIVAALLMGNTSVIMPINGGTGVQGTLTGIAYANGTSAYSVATATQIASAIGSGVYDASGAAATAQSNAETYASNASNLASGTVSASLLPAATATTAGAVTSIANVTVTVASSTTVSANSCSPASGGAGTSVTMVGLASSNTINMTPTTDTSNVTGWGNPAAGVLYILVTPGSGAFTYHLCNNTSASITTGSSATFNVSAK